MAGMLTVTEIVAANIIANASRSLDCVFVPGLPPLIGKVRRRKPSYQLSPQNCETNLVSLQDMRA